MRFLSRPDGVGSWHKTDSAATIVDGWRPVQSLSHQAARPAPMNAEKGAERPRQHWAVDSQDTGRNWSPARANGKVSCERRKTVTADRSAISHPVAALSSENVHTSPAESASWRPTTESESEPNPSGMPVVRVDERIPIGCVGDIAGTGRGNGADREATRAAGAPEFHASARNEGRNEGRNRPSLDSSAHRCSNEQPKDNGLSEVAAGVALIKVPARTPMHKGSDVTSSSLPRSLPRGDDSLTMAGDALTTLLEACDTVHAQFNSPDTALGGAETSGKSHLRRMQEASARTASAADNTTRLRDSNFAPRNCKQERLGRSSPHGPGDEHDGRRDAHVPWQLVNDRLGPLPRHLIAQQGESEGSARACRWESDDDALASPAEATRDAPQPVAQLAGAFVHLTCRPLAAGDSWWVVEDGLVTRHDPLAAGHLDQRGQGVTLKQLLDDESRSQEVLDHTTAGAARGEETMAEDDDQPGDVGQAPPPKRYIQWLLETQSTRVGATVSSGASEDLDATGPVGYSYCSAGGRGAGRGRRSKTLSMVAGAESSMGEHLTRGLSTRIVHGNSREINETEVQPCMFHALCAPVSTKQRYMPLRIHTSFPVTSRTLRVWPKSQAGPRRLVTRSSTSKLAASPSLDPTSTLPPTRSSPIDRANLLLRHFSSSAPQPAPGKWLAHIFPVFSAPLSITLRSHSRHLVLRESPTNPTPAPTQTRQIQTWLLSPSPKRASTPRPRPLTPLARSVLPTPSSTASSLRRMASPSLLSTIFRCTPMSNRPSST